jgi:RNA recognition motif-containing protein
VEFETVAEAEAARNKMDGSEIDGRPIFVREVTFIQSNISHVYRTGKVERINQGIDPMIDPMIDIRQRNTTT